MKTDNKPKKKNKMKIASAFGLVGALIIAGVSLIGADSASAASWNDFQPGHWNNNHQRHTPVRNTNWQRQNRATLAGKVTYAGPSHLDVQARNNDYYFNAGGARVVNRHGSQIKIDSINKGDYLVAYGTWSDGNFSPTFIRDLSRR